MCFGELLKSFKLRDYFERFLYWLDYWLSCMWDCIHICVFLLSKNCFKKLAQHLFDTSSIPCCMSSYFSFFLLQSWQLLDTWWIDRASILGSDELFLNTCSIPQLLTIIFSTPSLTASSTPLDTSSVEIYWRFYISLLVQSEPHFIRYLSRLFSVFSPELSHLTSILILKGFFKLFQDFVLLVSF